MTRTDAVAQIMQGTESSTTTEKRPDRPRSNVPTSGDGAPPTDGDDAGAVSYDSLFGTPALVDDEPDDVWGDPKAEPPTIPPMSFTAYPPQKVLYKAAFRAAYKYPDALMLVMQGVRKGLKRGKKAAQEAGGQDR